MEVKGISWIGNVYQKFEAMCLEVEEVMYKDTVDYVENQVQNVGASVKRFYSGVMQDLLSPTSLDAEKVLPFCFTVEQDSDEGVCKKTNASKKKERSKVTPDVGEDVVVAPLIHVRLDVDNLCRPSGGFAKGPCSGLRSRRRRGQCKINSSSFDVNQNQSEEKLNSFVASPATCPPERESSSCSECVIENPEFSQDQTATIRTLSLNEDSMSHDVFEICNDTENASRLIDVLSNDFKSSNEIVLIESVGNSIEVPSSGGILTESNDAGSSKSDEARYDKYVDEEMFVPQQSSPRKLFDWNLATDIETAKEHEAEIIQQSNKAKLSETIVVVNEDDLRFLPQQESKKRPYKKKIRDAIYSTMRSGRKHEYKQLVLQYGDSKHPNHEETLTPTLSADNTKKLPDPDSCESEWEIL